MSNCYCFLYTYFYDYISNEKYMEHISCNYGFQKVMVRQGRGRGKQEKKIKDCAKNQQLEWVLP